LVMVTSESPIVSTSERAAITAAYSGNRPARPVRPIQVRHQSSAVSRSAGGKVR
jgi:hypothetical protein